MLKYVHDFHGFEGEEKTLKRLLHNWQLQQDSLRYIHMFKLFSCHMVKNLLIKNIFSQMQKGYQKRKRTWMNYKKHWTLTENRSQHASDKFMKPFNAIRSCTTENRGKIKLQLRRLKLLWNCLPVMTQMISWNSHHHHLPFLD